MNRADEAVYRAALEARAAEAQAIAKPQSQADVPADDTPCDGACSCHVEGFDHGFEDGWVTGWMTAMGDTPEDAEVAFDEYIENMENE
jgi:hypothetical protein